MKKTILCIALLPACAACTDSQGTDAAPTPTATVRIAHDRLTFAAPYFSGSAPSGTIDWGDGRTESYSPSATHTYAGAASRTVTIETRGVDRMTLADLEGVAAIDLSAFTAN